MGILGLAKLIADICPQAIKEYELKSYFGRKVAVDASMSIYQFLIAIRNNNLMMTNESGDTTSHLVGLFYRTCKLLEAGIKPVYVFDGKAPEFKAGELEKRKERRAEAEAKLKEAKEDENQEDIGKFSKRLVRVTRQHNEECKKLLQLMGVPVVCAPSEAEAQCAQLAKENLVYGIATEDMDGLTFGTPRLIRHLSSGNTDKCKEFVLEKVLEGLEITYEQFIDLCILMGCDYCESIKGIGGKKGLELIKEHGSIEEILRKRYGITEFIDPEITYREKIRDIEKVDVTPEDVNEAGEENAGNSEKENGEKVIKKENGEAKEEKGEAKEEKQDEDQEHKVKKEKEIKTEALDTSENIDGEEKNNDSFNKNENVEDSDDEIVVKKKKKNVKVEDDKDDSLEGSGEELDEDKPDEKSKKKKKGGSREIVPENWLFRGARKLFLQPNVSVNSFTEHDLRCKDIDEQGLIDFLCKENGFSEDRVKSGIKRIKESKGKCAQTRIDSFFKVLPSKSPVKKETPAKAGQKRAAPAGKATGNKRGRKPK